MKQAVVIHPRLTEYGGGEIIMLHVAKILQDLGYSVSIVTDNYNPQEIEENFRMGQIMEQCIPVLIPPFRPLFSRFLALQRLPYSRKVLKIVKGLKADIAFSTQSVLYYHPNVLTYQVVYDLADLFEIVGLGYARGPLASLWKKPYYKLLRKIFKNNFSAERLCIPLSQALERQLSNLGYPHSAVTFPPCDLIFRPKQKQRRVTLVSRIAPQKRIEDFMTVARSLPLHKFTLVGLYSEAYPAYYKKIQSMKPSNVEYFETPIRDRPELVEESRVYLYTSQEPGIGIALGQAMGAGCVPVTPAWGGGAEMVLETQVGYMYDSIDDAVRKVDRALKSDEARDSPPLIAERAKIFSSENFENRIRRLVLDPPKGAFS